MELSDTETYKGVPAKHALILWLSALFFSSYTDCEAAEGLKNPTPLWRETEFHTAHLYNKDIDF